MCTAVLLVKLANAAAPNPHVSSAAVFAQSARRAPCRDREAAVAGALDRLLHRSEIIDIEGESYRLKEAKERAETKSATRAKKRA